MTLDLRKLPDASTVQDAIIKAKDLITYRKENPGRFRTGYDSDETRAWWNVLQSLRMHVRDGCNLAASLRARALLVSDEMRALDCEEVR